MYVFYRVKTQLVNNLYCIYILIKIIVHVITVIYLLRNNISLRLRNGFKRKFIHTKGHANLLKMTLVQNGIKLCI